MFYLFLIIKRNSEYYLPRQYHSNCKLLAVKFLLDLIHRQTILLLIIFKNFFKFFYSKVDGIFVNSKEMKLRLKKIFGLNSNLVYNNLNIKNKIIIQKKNKIGSFKILI